MRALRLCGRLVAAAAPANIGIPPAPSPPLFPHPHTDTFPLLLLDNKICNKARISLSSRNQVLLPAHTPSPTQLLSPTHCWHFPPIARQLAFSCSTMRFAEGALSSHWIQLYQTILFSDFLLAWQGTVWQWVLPWQGLLKPAVVPWVVHAAAKCQSRCDLKVENELFCKKR